LPAQLSRGLLFFSFFFSTPAMTLTCLLTLAFTIRRVSDCLGRCRSRSAPLARATNGQRCRIWLQSTSATNGPRIWSGASPQSV